MGADGQTRGSHHWKDGRSAKELAKSWVAGEGPAALARLFDSNAETRGLTVETAVAEAQISFDKHPGGKRNHDLLIWGPLRGRINRCWT